MCKHLHTTFYGHALKDRVWCEDCESFVHIMQAFNNQNQQMLELMVELIKGQIAAMRKTTD